MKDLSWFSRDLTALVHPLAPARVYTILASTGAGKSLVGVNQVSHTLQENGVRVMVVATEEAPRYCDLLACRAAGVSYAAYFYKRLTEDEQRDVAHWRSFYERHDRLYMLPTLEPTLADIGRAMNEHGVPDLLVVDHLHNLDDQGRRLPDFLAVAMRTFSEAATKLDLAVLLLAQVHRPQARDPLYPYRIPTPTSGLGSPKIEQRTDVLLGVSRKLRDDVPKEVLARLAKGLLRRGESVRQYEEPGTARITVLKHRIDDDASRRSLLLTVRYGKIQDRIALAEGTTGQWVEKDEDDDRPPF